MCFFRHLPAWRETTKVLAAAGRDPGGGGGGEAEDAARTAAMAADNIILEVAAYPAGLFSPPKTAGEHEHHQQQQGKKLRGEGRRRVVLTAESLWKRRRLMRPKAILSEKPPLTLAGWLERESSDVNSPSGTEARDQAGSEEGAAEDGTGHEGPRDEASVGNGSDAGGNGQRGVGRKAQAEALDDLVNMVAFGPIDDRQGRSNGACAHVSVCVLCVRNHFSEGLDCRLGHVNVRLAADLPVNTKRV